MTARLRYLFLFFVFALIASELLTSCNRIYRHYCCPSLRRPQVMTGAVDCVLDYNVGFEEGAEKFCPPCDCDGEDRVPLTSEDFNPWKPLEKELLLSIGDILDIGIFGDEDTFYNEVVIAPDGRLYYAFLDGVPAEGRTIDEISSEMENLLTKYFIHPIVTITPVFAANQSYRVLGRVGKPGVFPLMGPLHLREAIGEAGGLLQEDFNDRNNTNQQLEEIVDLKHSFIVRDGSKLDVDFKSLMHNPTSREDIFIKPGDYIYIASNVPEQVYVLGAVRAPQRLEYFKGMTLMEAISEAGGWVWGEPYSTEMNRVMVIRGRLECPLVVEADVTLILRGEATNIVLAPGDIVYVLNKTMRFGRALVRLAINTFIQSFATAAGSYYATFEWLRISLPDADVSGGTD